METLSTLAQVLPTLLGLGLLGPLLLLGDRLGRGLRLYFAIVTVISLAIECWILWELLSGSQKVPDLLLGAFWVGLGGPLLGIIITLVAWVRQSDDGGRDTARRLED